MVEHGMMAGDYGLLTKKGVPWFGVDLQKTSMNWALPI
jgi:hypothetical protein